MFPKILHQTWKTTDLSDVREFDLCSQTWRRHHPEFDYRLWDDSANESFVRERFAEYYPTWASFDKNIKRVDAIRYMWMYEYGGIYADLDMECLQSVEPLAEQRADRDIILFCDLDSTGRCLSANPALIISRPGSEFWLEALQYAKENRNEYVTHCTGPYALGILANRHRERFGIALLDQNALFIRKSRKRFYRSIPGNEDDYRVYENVSCATEKPPKYFEDRKRKFVADWHATPAEHRWHLEYAGASKIARLFRSARRRWRALGRSRSGGGR